MIVSDRKLLISLLTTQTPLSVFTDSYKRCNLITEYGKSTFNLVSHLFRESFLTIID